MNAAERSSVIDFASKCLMALLVFVIILLTVTLSQAWRNERFLDAELNKHTTTSTNQIK